MAARTQSESAQRISGCVTALLRDQPFFGSLALRLPLRADASRETVASDGCEIRYAPQWIADAQAHFIETAIGRVVLACALKHHTRRGERDPERWQRASQLVTHALLRDAGFTLPPDAEAWEGMSVEQAYDRLAGEQDDGDGQDDPSPSAGGGAGGAMSGPQPGGDDDDDDSGDSGDSADTPGDGDGEGQDDPDGDGPGEDGGTDAPPSFDPSGTGEVMDAPGRRQRWRQQRFRRDPGRHHGRGTGMGRGRAPGAQSRQGPGQGPGRHRGDHPERPCQPPRLAGAAAQIHDRRGAQRL